MLRLLTKKLRNQSLNEIKPADQVNFIGFFFFSTICFLAAILIFKLHIIDIIHYKLANFMSYMSLYVMLMPTSKFFG